MCKNTQEDGREIKVLPWGLDIKVAECKPDDLKWIFADSRVNSAILMLADAVTAAQWFNGKWGIKEDGTLVRPELLAPKKENIKFRCVLLNPLSPDGNFGTLIVFKKLQEGLLAFDRINTAGIILGSTQRISVIGDEFCLWDVQQEYDGG